MDVECGLKYIKICYSFHLKQHVEIKTSKTICNHDV
jgi:hypothetical protein